MNKLDITTIILTYNEEIHIRRCLENVCPFSKHVIVVDSPSTDRTIEICNSTNTTTGEREFPEVEVVVHKYPGNQAEQFNWALDNLDIKTEWILRLDADEYCTEELIKEMFERLPTLSENTTACVLPLGRAFMGRRLKHGIVNGISMIRLFKKGKARYEQRIMDEHLKLLEGNTVSFKGKFVDDNRLPLKGFIDKHNNYSSREAFVLLDTEYKLIFSEKKDNTSEFAKEVAAKRKQKAKYAKMPIFLRSFLYFIYRYIFKLGFLDGKEGFCWDFLQGWWYRTLVDAKILEVRKAVFGSSKRQKKITDEQREALKDYIEKNWGIKLRG